MIYHGTHKHLQLDALQIINMLIISQVLIELQDDLKHLLPFTCGLDTAARSERSGAIRQDFVFNNTRIIGRIHPWVPCVHRHVSRKLTSHMLGKWLNRNHFSFSLPIAYHLFVVTVYNSYRYKRQYTGSS